MIYRSIEEIPAHFGPSAVTVGNFDGVHSGHRAIMRRTAEVAREHGWKAVVVTFDPHPAMLLAPQRAPKLLTTLGQRCALIEPQGIGDILVLPFTPDLAKLTPEDFTRQVLIGALDARMVLLGYNFRFGKGAAGTPHTLSELGKQFGFRTEVVPAVLWRNRIVSSSEVRKLIEGGHVSLACRLLERPHELDGKVVPGRGVGSRQTVPTLNLDTPAEVLPGTGVYITETRDAESTRQWDSITNVGYRPTFGGSSLTIETFLLTPLEGVTPERIRVGFLRRLRAERKFESAETLKMQILKDAAVAQAYFRRRRAWTGHTTAVRENVPMLR